MLNISRFSAVIFDMDGLVLDTERTYFIAWQHAAKAMGYHLSDEFCQSVSGLGGTDVKEKLLLECGADFDLQGFKQQADVAWHQHVHQHGIEIKTGFVELLAFIHQHQLPYCLATNSRRTNAVECLALAGLSTVFSTIISRDEVQHSKPAPDIFLAAAHTLQVPIQHCLVLEDSHTGVVAASKAGAFTLYVPSTVQIATQTIELCDLMLPDLLHVLESLHV
jgi:HAD superfamily hydrolase (TIGR01509 family)